MWWSTTTSARSRRRQGSVVSELVSDRVSGWVTVRAPATSANLGPGFDSLGLCLDLADLVSAEVAREGTEVVVLGEGAGDLPTDDSNLVVTSIRRAFDVWGVPQPGLRLRCRNVIPHARGLGSSAAAIVAGLRLAQALAANHSASESEAVAFATALEGHPDNVAACLLGGLTIAWMDEASPTAIRLDVDQRVAPVVFCAERPSSTRLSRGLLPETVEHGRASANSAHAALLVVALTSRPDLLLPATHDFLHQEARRPAMPESMQLVDTLREAGVPAVISGAGPSVLALCTTGQAAQLARRVPPGWRLMRLSVDPMGARIVSG
jgi:homoserine kinase